MVKVIMISQSSELYRILEQYIEQINDMTNKKYTLNWLDEFEEWDNSLNNIHYDIYLIDENILPPLTLEYIDNIKQKNNFAPIR